MRVLQSFYWVPHNPHTGLFYNRETEAFTDTLSQAVGIVTTNEAVDISIAYPETVFIPVCAVAVQVVKNQELRQRN